LKKKKESFQHRKGKAQGGSKKKSHLPKRIAPEGVEINQRVEKGKQVWKPGNKRVRWGKH